MWRRAGLPPSPRTISGGLHGQQPIVSLVLIAVNLVIFLVTMIQGGGESGLGRSPGSSTGALAPMTFASGDWWQLVTSGFLHVTVLHIVMNLVSLYMIGVGLERVLGPASSAWSTCSACWVDPWPSTCSRTPTCGPPVPPGPSSDCSVRSR